jgi:hypothetical protein
MNREQLAIRVLILEAALRNIFEWKLPRSDHMGSNGERDHMKKVAEDALRASHEVSGD